MLADFAHHVLGFIEVHRDWSPIIVGVLAFCESLAVVSFFVPATVILIGVGTLIAPAHLSFVALWAGAAIGAVLGDWLSYAVGRYVDGDKLAARLGGRHRETIEKAFAFMRRWGVAGVFVGRFSGPLRAFVPLVAGMLPVAQWQFQIANVASAALWAAALLSPGSLVGKWFNW